MRISALLLTVLFVSGLMIGCGGKTEVAPDEAADRRATEKANAPDPKQMIPPE